MRFRAVGCAAAVLVCGWAALAAEYSGRPLVDVLKQLRGEGLELIYSSAVVGEELRVTVEPTSTRPRDRLEEILQAVGLRAEDGPGGTILILPARPAAEDPAKPGTRPHLVTEVVVTPNRHSVVRREQSARHAITGDEAVLVPTIGGDITRVVELLPGVAVADNSAAFNVRGSDARDVSLVLDGLELYDPFHLQSFHSPFSLIDSNVVDRVDFFGGGFTADLGDRHGGFVEVQTVAPGALTGGELEIGTLNSRVSYRAPMKQRAGSWLFNARAWYPEAVRDTTELGAGEQLNPQFADVYAKAAFTVGARHRISAHALLAYDRINFTERTEVVNEKVDALTRNGYAWVRAISAWSKNVTSETVLSGGRIERIRDGISSVNGPVVVDDDRVVHFLGVKHDSTWRISDEQVFKAGAEVRSLEARYRYSSASTSLQLDPGGISAGVYAAHRLRITPKLATELGARWDRQAYTSDNQISPRFNAVWSPRERTELLLAVGRFHQSQRIHELNVQDGETQFSRAEVAEQAELSLRQGLRGGLQVRLDGYYRRLSTLRPRYENLFEPVELFPETAEDRVALAPDRARLQGVELLVRGDADRPLFWWFSYALSSAEDSIGGRDVPRSWDQTHAGKFLIGYRKRDAWSVSLSGSAHTGWPTTPLVNAAGTPVPDERNTDRFDLYARVDLKARRSIALREGKLWLTVEVVNLTDRNNACCLNEVFVQPDGSVRREFDYWLGISPSFSVLWEY